MDFIFALNLSVAADILFIDGVNLFTISANGGVPIRVTFHSADDILNDFAADNNLLFTTSRTFRQVEWDHEFATVPANGGTPELLIDAVGEMPAKSPDGRFIVFVKGLLSTFPI